MGGEHELHAQVEQRGAPGWSADSTRLIYPHHGTFAVRSIVTGSVIPVAGLPPSLIVSGRSTWQPR
jgi:hypothetical protein